VAYSAVSLQFEAHSQADCPNLQWQDLKEIPQVCDPEIGSKNRKPDLPHPLVAIGIEQVAEKRSGAL